MKQTQAIILVIGIIILGTVGAVIFFQKDLAKVASKNGPDATKAAQDLRPKARNIENNSRLVRVQSVVKGYKATIENEAFLVQTLESEHLFGRTFLYSKKYNSTTGKKPINEIHLLVRDSVQQTIPDFSDNMYVYLYEGVILVNAVVTPKQLEEKGIEDTLLKNFIGAILVTEFPDLTVSEVTSKVSKIFSTLMKESDIYIRITKQ